MNSGGAAQLALAMMCDFFNDDNKGLEFYEEFKTDMIAPIGGTSWSMKSEALVEWARRKMQERKSASKGPTF